AALPLAAVWSETLLRELGPARFLELYRGLSTTPVAAAATPATVVRPKVEAASGKRGPALTTWVRERGVLFVPPLNGGCTKLPVESRSRQPILRWRDAIYIRADDAIQDGDAYVFTSGPYQGP